MIESANYAVLPPLFDIGLQNNLNVSKPIFENGIWQTPSLPLAEGYYQAGELFMSRMKENADLVGQIDPETGIEETYGDMLDRSIRSALWLKKQGVKPGDIIAVSTKDHLDSLIPLIATFMIGAVVNLWWTTISGDVINNLIKQYNPKVVFLDNDKFGITSKEIKDARMNTSIICFQETNGCVPLSKILSDQDAKEVSDFECTRIKSPDQLAMILPTSGSTGLPKGVMIGYKSVSKFPVSLPDSSLRVKMSPALVLSSYPFISKVETSLNFIAAGITIIISKPSLTGLHPLQIIERYKVRWVFFIVPKAAQLPEDLESTKSNISSIRYAVTGGTFMPDSQFNRFAQALPNAEVFFSYGISEAVGKVAYTSYPKRQGSSGKFIVNTQFKVVNENGSVILEPRKPGELYIKHHRLFLGYYNNPEATTKALDHEGWYHTGDVAYFDEDGEIYIVDRIKDFIRTGNHSMSAAVIDGLISEHTGVLEVAVVGKVKGGDEFTVAFIVKKADADIKKEDIIRMVPQKSAILYLDYVIFVNSLPRTLSGKINKSALREIVEKMSLEDIANSDGVLNLIF